jgi:Cu-Zn family superoxide dismutase
MRHLTYCGAAMTALAGCVTQSPPLEPADAGPPVRPFAAEVRNAIGQVKAQASLVEVGGGIRVKVDAQDMPPGAYGAHIHAVGRCDPPGFESAGPHWNPTGMKHGKANPQGMHRGDLPNLMVGTDGMGGLEITIPGTSIAGAATSLIDADGAAIVIHTSADDYRTDPSGNSGARIACGVFR